MAILRMSIFLIFFFIISEFLYDLEGAPLNKKEISTKCYLCSEETGGCSSENNLQIERCSLEDHFDKCIVVQAFSRTKNLTVIKRECASQRSCEQRESCADPDFSDCRFECCSGDLCNNFNFTDDKSTVHTTSKAGLSIATETTKSNIMSAEEPSDVLSGPENTLISAKGDPCTDLDPSCPVYVASFNFTFCKKSFEFTEHACRKTCKFCLSAEEKVEKTTEKPTESLSTEEPSKPEPSTPEPSTPEPSTPEPSTPEPSTPEPSTPEPSTPEPKTTKKGNLAVNSESSSELSTTESSKANEVDRMTKKFDPKIRSDCRDIDPKCSAYAQSFCEINKQYSKVACEKTCGFCVLPGEKSTVPSTQKSTVPTKKSTVPSTQKSTVSTKKSTVPSTSTATTTTKKSTVPSTPTAIFTNCEDLRSDCSEFKKMDYCRLFSLLSDSVCRKTCGLCDVLAGPAVVDISPDTTTVESTEGTKLHPETTKLLNTAPTTSKSTITVTSSMSTKISTTEAITKLVTKSSLGPKINQKDCYDKRPKCATFAKYDGYCEYSRDFMSINCPKSCGFCDGNGSNVVIATETATESSQVMTPSKSTSEKISTSTTSESSRDISTTDNQIQQGPDVSTPGNIRILAPANPETSPYGNNLRWKIWPWSECDNGQQWRVVRCYHLFNGIDYHVTITACIEHVAPMPLKYRNC